jgi:hypothetical protein
MILSKFRDSAIKKKIEKELLNSDKSLVSISDKKINSILVFIDEKTTNNSNQILAKELNIDISKIKVVDYVNKLPKELSSEGFLTDKDFNWLGKIKSDVVENVINSDFDVLLNLTSNNLLIDYLVVLSKARFKTGFSSADNRLYDFMIAVDNNDITVFSKELKKYLEILNKL